MTNKIGEMDHILESIFNDCKYLDNSSTPIMLFAKDSHGPFFLFDVLGIISIPLVKEALGFNSLCFDECEDNFNHTQFHQWRIVDLKEFLKLISSKAFFDAKRIEKERLIKEKCTIDAYICTEDEQDSNYDIEEEMIIQESSSPSDSIYKNTYTEERDLT